jgi:hypothetical protein
MRRLFALAAVLAGAACIAGCSTGRPSPQLAYCTQLHSHFYRYRPLPRASHAGEIARAEYAIYECRQGRYAESIATLTAMIRRHRVAVPPPPKALAPKPVVDDDPEPYE